MNAPKDKGKAIEVRSSLIPSMPTHLVLITVPLDGKVRANGALYVSKKHLQDLDTLKGKKRTW